VQLGLAKSADRSRYSVSHTTGDAAALEEGLRYIANGVHRGAFRPVLDRTFALEDIVAAHRHLEASDQIGKVVAVPRAPTG
jgi:NADPH:quinone reductase-like Zn-dependent oxidoreductase